MLKKAVLLSLALFVIPCISHAEIKTYTHTVKQAFGGSQSPDDARAAIHKAKREALEKEETYMESLNLKFAPFLLPRQPLWSTEFHKFETKR